MTQTKARIQRIEAIRAILVSRFPKAFLPKGAEKVPLKVGIINDIFAAAPDLDVKAVSGAVADYCQGIKYLRHLIEGAPRFDLAGSQAGIVSAEEAKQAERALLFWHAKSWSKIEISRLREVARAAHGLLGSNSLIESPATARLAIALHNYGNGYEVADPERVGALRKLASVAVPQSKVA